MKKVTLLVCFALSTVLLFAQEITYSNLRTGNGIAIGLTLQSYDIEPLQYRGEQMHEITLSGIFLPNEEGMPNLPCISKVIAIPNGAEVRVSVKSMETERLQNINIAPALKIQAIPEDPVMDYVKNDRVYTANEFYPQEIYHVSEVTSIRGIDAVVLGICPFQFNPVTKELVVIHHIEFEVEYVGGSKDYGITKYRSPWFDPILRNHILNYEVLDGMEYGGKSAKDGEGCEYLIVIPNRDDFEPFAEQIKDFRTKQGIYTKVMRLDEMGVTTTTALKTWLHNAYNTWDIPPVAVLLMGDHHTNMTIGIPAETISHPYSGTCITDNQYADVTGNKLPDMVFGRMAAETEADMTTLISKFLEYETQPCMESSYYQNPITALGWQTERWFQICSEAVGGYWRNQGKTPVRINAIYEGTPGSSWSSNQNTSMVVNYFGPNGAGYIPAAPSELGGWSGGVPSQVVTAVNNGAFALQHRDHGFVNGWGEPAFQSSHISQLNNVGKMTYLFTINCETGKFNNSSPCFGEVFHRHTHQGQNAGAVGFLGPTEVSYSFVNDAFAWGMYDLFDPDFLPQHGPSYGPANGPYVGYSGNWMPAFGNVAGKYFLYETNWPYNSESKIITYQMFTAHSDVFLRLFTEVPQELAVSHADVSLAGNPNFLISANEGALIALTAEIDGNLEILDVAIATGTTQTMNIPSTLIPTTEIHVVITGQNFLRYDEIVTVVPAEGPYVVCTGYSVTEEDALTYISTNSEIEVSLKNVGVESTANLLNITISTTDPQLTLNSTTATCTSIAPDGIATVNFNVTIANDIVDNKTFSVDVAVTEGAKMSWPSKLNLKAYAPKFKLEKVLIDGVDGGNLKKGTLVMVTTIIKNEGHADAYGAIGDLEVNSPYITLACEEQGKESKNIAVGESIEFSFYVITSPNMPYGHTAGFMLNLNAQYGRSFTTPFNATCTGSNAYCASGSQNCSDGDKFTSVILYKTSEPTNLLINNTNTTCTSGGYQDYTNTSVTLDPGQQYTIKVKCGYSSQTVGGWFDLNGNNLFDANEKLINLSCSSSGTEYSQNFTIPADFEPGSHRFRLITKYSGTPAACGNSSYGQTHDYTIVLPELYPRVQNVEAVLYDEDVKIEVSWEAPAEGSPIGYNIYRDGNKLNAAPVTDANYTETNITQGVYAYNVTAVYEGNKESFAEMSNVICNFIPPALCEKPVELEGIAEINDVTLSWNEPEHMDGYLLGYNIYRDDEPIGTTPAHIRTYDDKNLTVGIYTYQVSASYAHCEESEATEGVMVTIACPLPVNPEVEIENCGAVITWEAPETTDGLLGYNIYRDGEIANEEPVTATEYFDEILENGIYVYQVSALFAYGESELTDEVTVDITCVGINDFQTASFKLFPNPAKNELNIEVYDMRYEICDVEIYDVYGRISYISNLKSQVSSLKIDISQLASGMYFVKIISEQGSVIKKVAVE